MSSRILYLLETFNPKTKETESVIIWSSLTPSEIKAHASDPFLLITGVLILTTTEVES